MQVCQLRQILPFCLNRTQKRHNKRAHLKTTLTVKCNAKGCELQSFRDMQEFNQRIRISIQLRLRYMHANHANLKLSNRHVEPTHQESSIYSQNLNKFYYKKRLQ